MEDEESFVILSGSPSMPSCATPGNGFNIEHVQDTPSNCQSFLERSQISNGTSSIYTQAPKSITLENSLKSADFRDFSLTQGVEEKSLDKSLTKANGVHCGIMEKDGGNPEEAVKRSSFEALGAASMATSFILGEKKAEDIKQASIYVQFPSFSKVANPEEITSLQTLICEHLELKKTCELADRVTREYYDFCKQNFQELRAEILSLKGENENLKVNLNAAKDEQNDQSNKKFEALEQKVSQLREEKDKLHNEVKQHNEHLEITTSLYQKDLDDLKIKLSEKDSLINNMRHHMEQLEAQQGTFELVNQKEAEASKYSEELKKLQDRFSNLETENKTLKIKIQVCEKELEGACVSQAQTEELLKAAQGDIALLQAKDFEKTKTIDYMRSEILVSKQQLAQYEQDFEAERKSREEMAGDKEKILQELKSLRDRNEHLLAEFLKAKSQKPLPNNSTEPQSLEGAVGGQTPIKAKVPAYENPERPVRNLSQIDDVPHRCPVCNKGFNNTSVLQSHVNDCLDKQA